MRAAALVGGVEDQTVLLRSGFADLRKCSAVLPGPFDPGLWLGAFTSIGGGYALMSDRRLTFLVEDCDAEGLTCVMGQIIGQPERQEALKSAIERRQCGEGV